MSSAPTDPSPQIHLSSEAIGRLDLSPLLAWSALPPAALLARAGLVELHFDWPRSPEDPRELSELPELRLWSLRADAIHPLLPLLLERSSGQLTRHVAMLLPHGFNRTEGIRFAPESLELWLSHRLFLLDDWLRAAGINGRAGLGQMAAVLGYELDPGFWSALPSPAGAAGDHP
ncbi:MAG: CRR6 family NdhI maturation factor [Cyanobium sp.]